MAIARNNPQSLNSVTNTSSYTLSYTVPSGSDRLLLGWAHLMRGVETDFTATATFNGTSLTQAATMFGSSASRWYRTYIWYLIAPSVMTANLVVASSASIQGAIVGAATLTGAAQSNVLGQTGTATGDPANFSLVGCLSGSFILALVVSNSNGTPAWTWTTATKDYDLNNGNDSSEVAGSAGYYFVPSGGNVTLSAERTGTPPAQVGCVAEFKRLPTSGVKPILHYHKLIRSNA